MARSSFRIEADTIVEAFRRNVQQLADRPALRRRQAVGWETLTWSDYGRAAAEVGAALLELGLQPAARAAILSGNRAEWHIADFGILGIGGVTVPLYPTSSSEQVAYIL